jgi:SiaC family regulatory phosphoprotein
MEKLIIAATDEFPSVILDKENNKFEISGISIPHNSSDFYSPIIDWIKKYCKNPNPTTVLECKLDYFNTSSHKYITELFKIMDELFKAGSKVKIIWYYNLEDEDMKLIGQELSHFLEVPFEFKEF